MAAPFFQGNINDLLNVAGQGQGSYLLGQMMNRQRQAELGDIEKTGLANLQTRQTMDQNQQKFPFELQQLKAKIADFEAKTAQTGQQTRGLTFTNDVNAALGVERTAQGKGLDIQKAEQELNDAQRKQFENDLLSTPWSPGLRNSIFSMFSKGLPEAIASQAARASESKEAWDAFRDQYYKGSVAGRKETQAQEGRMALEGARGDTREAVARTMAEARKAAANARLPGIGQKVVEYVDKIVNPASTDAERNQAMSGLNLMIQFQSEARRNAIAQILAENQIDPSQFGLKTIPKAPPPGITYPGVQGGPAERSREGVVGAPDRGLPDPLGIR